jgi:hypothetical protein
LSIFAQVANKYLIFFCSLQQIQLNLGINNLCAILASASLASLKYTINLCANAILASFAKFCICVNPSLANVVQL